MDCVRATGHSESHLDQMNDESRNLGKRRRKFRIVDLHPGAGAVIRAVRSSGRFQTADVCKHVM